jgi:hypothetical protein
MRLLTDIIRHLSVEDLRNSLLLGATFALIWRIMSPLLLAQDYLEVP